MIKSISSLLKPENRKVFIQQAMKGMSKRQEELIKQADEIIGDVPLFEETVKKQFLSYVNKRK